MAATERVSLPWRVAESVGGVAAMRGHHELGELVARAPEVTRDYGRRRVLELDLQAATILAEVAELVLAPRGSRAALNRARNKLAARA